MVSKLGYLFLMICSLRDVISDPDPCTDVSCPRGAVCKLVEVCAPVCAVVSACAVPAPIDLGSNPCNVGTPLITTLGNEKACQVGGASCPGVLKCTSDPRTGEGRCCPTGGHKTSPATKQGRCHVKSSHGICFNFCSNDMDCPGADKCCSNGCGYACSSPEAVHSRSPVRSNSLKDHSTVLSPGGTCPQVTTFGDCIHTCSSDLDCERGRKCCSNGCGRTCQIPVLPPKPGTCPRDFNDRFCTARDQCKSDSHCPGTDKCCSTKCGRRCKNPHSSPAPRAGVCPSVSQSPDATFSCSVRFNLCQYDIECPSDMKCCQTACGNKCRPTLVREHMISALSQRPGGKSGQCPAPEDNENGEGSSLCISFCASDDDCPMTQKCCMRSDRCSFMCTHPIS